MYSFKVQHERVYVISWWSVHVTRLCGCHCGNDGVFHREKEHLDVREAMQREHIANEHKYSQAIKELQAKVS